MEGHTPSVRGGSPLAKQADFLTLQEGEITVYVDPRIRLKDENTPLSISFSGWWIFSSLKLANVQCATYDI